MKPRPVPVVIGGVAEPMSALNRVKIIENHEPLVDLRLCCPKLTFPSDAGQPGGMTPFLRQTVAEMLEAASNQTPAGYRFHAVSAWRSFELQKRIWHERYDQIKKDHPSWPESHLRRATNRYLAPIDHAAPPGHCTGAAIDIVWQTDDGHFIDLVPPDLTDWTLGHTWTDKVAPEVKKMRMRMLEIMAGVGFSNVRDEYWHYSYGDSGWAVRVGEKVCCYGLADLFDSDH